MVLLSTPEANMFMEGAQGFEGVVVPSDSSLSSGAFNGVGTMPMAMARKGHVVEPTRQSNISIHVRLFLVYNCVELLSGLPYLFGDLVLWRGY